MFGRGELYEIDELAHELSPESVSFVLWQSKLTSMYKSTIKLSSENKITRDKCWGLHLIDYMDKSVVSIIFAPPPPVSTPSIFLGATCS